MTCARPHQDLGGSPVPGQHHARADSGDTGDEREKPCGRRLAGQGEGLARCYTHAGSNVVLIMPLKDTCALLFTEGALVQDPEGLLVQPGENSQSARQMRFTSLAELTRLEKPLKAILKAAIAVEAAGLRVEFKKSTDLVYPKKFQDQLDKNSALREAFRALTPGRQRQYHMHFTGAKLATTRESRVGKAIPLILEGMGLND